ncbi:MAG: tetratricopeptide repeat protein [candidate division Zixibacteria bacterium]|nr:tetratricopeptide repeat protein [candidate division Zixibacteria bacterium]
MSLTSRQKKGFDCRLLEIEELFRQIRLDIARDALKNLRETDYSPDGYELGLYKMLEAWDLYTTGEYSKSIKLCEKANRLLASSAFHGRVGRIQWLLYKNYSALGNLNRAEICIRDAYAFFRRIDDKDGMIDALNGLGKLAFIKCDFKKSAQYIYDSIELSKGDNIRMAQLIGNLGRIEIHSGDWKSAEHNLKTALKLAHELKQPSSVIRNHLSLGYLHLRQRQFILSARELKSASMMIEKSNHSRENIILMEYEGELAYEMGDIVGARKILTKALDLSRELAGESTLVTQIARRLALVEQALENLDDALRIGQKALDLSIRLEEKTEIGLCRIVIAEVFASKKNYNSALDYCQEGLETIREVGDKYDLARTLLIVAKIYAESGEKNRNTVIKLYDEAFKLFNTLKLFYWSAECRFKQGIFCCEHANISRGFKSLYEAEKIFEKISERTRIRSIQLYMQELSKLAVNVSLSPDNEYKIFGNYFSEREYGDIKAGQIEEILNILAARTKAERVIIYSIGQNETEIISQSNLSRHQQKKFEKQFEELLGEEISSDNPTLMFDTRRDPFINDLLQTENNKVISSVLVTPLRLRKEITGYLYLDRLSSNGTVKPFGQNELNFVVGFADLISFKLAEYDKTVLEEDNKRLKAQLLEKATFPNIITQSKLLLEMLSRVQQVVDSDISLSIEGETGCGKDLLSKTIHYSSNRRDKRFISVNCAALPESLLESELFGYKKGAFTGADRDKTGLFEEADNGTFFLDEIADMPLSIQAKVLRILEEKEIVRLGETKPRQVNVRIISATNKDLKVEMEGGRFRQDLYYRLTALCFRIPPLRERREDIPLLIRHFAGDKIKFTPDTMKMMVAFDWPGNVRELENEVKKLVLLSGDSSMVDSTLLSSKITKASGKDGRHELEINTDIDFDDKFSLYDYLAEYEKRFIIKALRDQNGVKKHAAAFLNIPESTLRLKIKQYNIDSAGINSVN